ncbi:MATH and LRR domain-containing protein PFE0570w-like [Gordionus sp. m RMFG-2023]|uniref:MATH and LRR domain-containing protein PFE0570w-like n=1 Tax=Gordionus sp. m RMFG-2023 TaxID=3053472 RepID=UPI0031FE0DF8
MQENNNTVTSTKRKRGRPPKSLTNLQTEIQVKENITYRIHDTSSEFIANYPNKDIIDEVENVKHDNESYAYDSDKDPGWTPKSNQLPSSENIEGNISFKDTSSSSLHITDTGDINKESVKKTKLNNPAIIQSRAYSNDTFINKFEDISSNDRVMPSSTTFANNKRKYNNEERHAFRKGAFLIAKQDVCKFPECPVWRVDGPCLLQKYEPITLNDGQQKAFRKTLIFSGWANTTRKNYRPVQIQILLQVCRTVELISVTDISKTPNGDELENNLNSSVSNRYEESTDNSKNDANANLISRKDLTSGDHPRDVSIEDSGSRSTSLDKYPVLSENADVYLQLLLSSAIHPGFLEMVLKDGDEYFIKPYNKIEEFNKTYLESLILCSQKITSDQNYLALIKYLPDMEISNGFDAKECFACHSDPSNCVKVTLYGFPYEPHTLKQILLQTQNNTHNLDSQNENVSNEDNTESGNMDNLTEQIPMETINLCLNCLEIAQLFNKLYHMRYKLYQKCLDQINLLKQNPDISATQLLESSLFNQTWKLSIFQDFIDNWDKAYLYCTKFKDYENSQVLSTNDNLSINNNSQNLLNINVNNNKEFASQLPFNMLTGTSGGDNMPYGQSNLITNSDCSNNDPAIFLQQQNSITDKSLSSNSMILNQLNNANIVDHHTSDNSSSIILNNLQNSNIPEDPNNNGQGEILNFFVCQDENGNEVLCYYIPQQGEQNEQANPNNEENESNNLGLEIINETTRSNNLGNEGIDQIIEGSERLEKKRGIETDQRQDDSLTITSVGDYVNIDRDGSSDNTNSMNLQNLIMENSEFIMNNTALNQQSIIKNNTNLMVISNSKINFQNYEEKTDYNTLNNEIAHKNLEFGEQFHVIPDHQEVISVSQNNIIVDTSLGMDDNSLNQTNSAKFFISNTINNEGLNNELDIVKSNSAINEE